MVRRISVGILLVLLAVGCHQPSSSSSLSAKQVAQLVFPLQAAIASVQASTKLNPDVLSAQVDASINGSRAITPANLTTSTNSTTSAFPLTASGASQTPSDVYNSSSATTSTRRFPSSGYYYDVTSVQTDKLYFFYLTPVSGSTTKYTIQLYDYPMADFSVYYVYENYVVDDTNANSTTTGVWAWTPETTSGTIGSENLVETYYLDGTNDGGASTLATSVSTSGAVVYGAISPNMNGTPSSYTDTTYPYADPTIQAGYTNYTFPSGFADTSLASFSTFFNSLVPSGSLATVTNNVVTATGTTWSSKSLVSTSSLQKLTYYTEVAPTSGGSPYQYAYGLVYATDESAGSSSFDRTVTRYYIDFANKAQYYRSLTASGAKWNGGGASNSNVSKFTAVKTNLGQTSSGLITVNQSQQIWYASGASVATLASTSSTTTRDSIFNTVPSQYLGLTVTQTSSGAFTYAGTMNWLWNGYGNSYSVTVSGGVVLAQWTGSVTQSSVGGNSALSSNPRTTTTSTTPSYLSSSFSVPLQAYGTSLSIPVNGGTFVGTFDGTQFVGSFVYGSSSTRVVVDGATVTAMGTAFSPSDLTS